MNLIVLMIVAVALLGLGGVALARQFDRQRTVEFDESAGIWSIDISVRIDDPASGRSLGVMKAVLGVSLIQEVADKAEHERATLHDPLQKLPLDVVDHRAIPHTQRRIEKRRGAHKEDAAR